MLASFLQDIKQYFKGSQLLTEDKTYARILKLAETTQKCMPHFYSITNIATKLICTLKERIDDVQIFNIKEIRRRGSIERPIRYQKIIINHKLGNLIIR